MTNVRDHSRAAYVWTRLLRIPFWALFVFLPFILHEILHASVLEITLFVTLKPVTSLVSVYWSSATHAPFKNLRNSVMWATFLGLSPFLFVPLFPTAPYLLFATAMYMIFHRGAIPAWMEILKRGTPPKGQGTTFSYTAICTYLGGGILPLYLGKWLDLFPEQWVYFPVGAALLGLTALIPQLFIRLSPPKEEHAKRSQPLRNALKTLSQRSGFSTFQWGYMFGGAGLMILQPAFPRYFMDVLGLSFSELGIAIALCKGIGYAATAPLWGGSFHGSNILRLSALVTVLSGLFPLILLLGSVHLWFVFAGYVAYGVMQAGSELSWNLSGIIFSQDGNSAPYTEVNVLTVGLRGAVAPSLGGVLLRLAGPIPILGIAALLCFAGTAVLLQPVREPEAALG